MWKRIASALLYVVSGAVVEHWSGLGRVVGEMLKAIAASLI